MNVITMDADISVFMRMFQTLGDIVPEDAIDFLRDETARLDEEIVRQLKQRNRGNQLKRIISDVNKVFRPMPRKPFRLASQMNGKGMKWLYAGVTKKSGDGILLGVKPHRYHDQDTVADMNRVFYKSKGNLPKPAYVELGTIQTSRWNQKKGRGRVQHVMELRRNVVPRQSYTGFIALIKSKQGRLEASLAQTAQYLRAGGAKVDAFIKKHFPSKTNITNLDGLANKSYPRIEFGSFAPGIQGFEEYFHDGIEVRLYKMEQRYRLILSGYAEDVAQSISPRRRAKALANQE